MRSAPTLIAFMWTALAVAGETVIAVSADDVRPEIASVRSGDRVRWRGPDNVQLELDLEDHGDQHVFAARTSDVAVTFLDIGRHRYTVRIAGHPWLRGEVIVDPGAFPSFIECGPRSTWAVCVQP